MRGNRKRMKCGPSQRNCGEIDRNEVEPIAEENAKPKEQEMKVIAEDPETKEKIEAEVDGLEQDDLKFLETFHFPENKNPESAVRRYIEKQDISADQKAKFWKKLQIFAQATIRVGNKVLRIGRKIFDFILHLVKLYPNLTIGLAFGAVIAALVSAIPVIGFLFGGLAKIIIPLIGGILGFKEDLAERAFKRRVLDVINDQSVEQTIEKEVQNFEPLNKRS